MVLRAAVCASMMVLVPACGGSRRDAAASSDCDYVVEDTKMAGRTGVEGAKTGVKTGVEGVKTFGGATAGLVTGGGDEAKERWREGKERTRATAHEGAGHTSNAAHSGKCR